MWHTNNFYLKWLLQISVIWSQAGILQLTIQLVLPVAQQLSVNVFQKKKDLQLCH